MANKRHNIKRKIGEIYREKGRFPTLQEMNNILSFTSSQTRKHMRALTEDGYIVPKGDWYTFPEEGSLEPVPVEQVETQINKIIEESQKQADKFKGESELVKEIDKTLAEKHPEVFTEVEKSITKPLKITPEMKERVKKKWLKWKKDQKPKKKKPAKRRVKEDLALAMYIIRGIMFIVGIGSIAISIYYNIKLSMQFLPGIFAVVGGCIFVLFAVVSFETIIYFFIYRMAIWKKIIAISGFIFLWVIVTLFSMSAVFYGRYDRYEFNEKAQYSENRVINAGKLRWQNIQEQKTDIEKRMLGKRRQLEQLYKISEGITDLESRKENEEIFKNTQWRISLVEKDLKSLTIKLDIIRKAELKELDENPEFTTADKMAGHNDSFYDWLARIFGTTKEKIQFLISLAPAAFFDIVSSISMSIFLFLRKQ